MELEELKNAWTSVDERLKKQEILKESIIREMIYTKTTKSLKKLFWSDSIGIPGILFLIPFIVYAYGKFGGKYIFWDSTIIIAGIYCIVYLPFLIYRVYGLMKIDLSENIKNNLFYINRYKIQIKREKFATTLFTSVMIILAILMLIELKANTFHWTFVICLFIFLILFTYWQYNKFYHKNIQSIQKNLEELRELEE